ncbi:thiol peroxidase, atypical 2-Cys peroxiredoxin [Dysgonomonas alginatilytica]|uniref:Thiol peroxidase n=1 Tax=Dysgonomonas alginatilytica TaxID=1605892 RepID=A0A2V3PRP6_9BACT|nr:thiol peroxidase [Dysgonomonas alginatilytica]PXV65055.1 thiol peroxidase, atypical 2-Cys peroxiredoxin [Dysgonomonas alginatilytica]
MSQITLGGQAVNTIGNLPSVKSKAPAFTLVKQDLSELSLSDLKGKNVILNIFPSLDTSTCAASVRKFNKGAASLSNTVILAVSADLPFAAGRFCTTEGIENVIPVSVFRDQAFARDYGVLLVDGPLKGLLARSLVVVNAEGEVVYTELVPEIKDEPNYEAALAILK